MNEKERDEIRKERGDFGGPAPKENPYRGEKTKHDPKLTGPAPAHDSTPPTGPMPAPREEG